VKRDMDLIRKILLAVEAHPHYGKWDVPLVFEQTATPPDLAVTATPPDLAKFLQDAYAEKYPHLPPLESYLKDRFQNYSEEAVSYHLKLLTEAGLIEARNLKGTTTWAVNGLTWAGHEFLEASRDDSRWEKVKRLVVDKTGSLSFEVVKLALMED
jgi:DNA-binding transcriptional ArsR family regulator